MNHLSHRDLRNQPNERSRNASPASFNMATLDSLESQNDERIEGLGAKVRMLKDITVAIGDEVRESSKMLGSMVSSTKLLEY
ncbi:Protein transport protein bet1 [Neolecta irregularis DAH-3]|uniref:Protein transport protein bet1 n=1 Tax=Neolecta irregularis (strain DAH-3) TaxID=1198029 RepID=A0A1U7LM45_NEOID|nr:Protein transport protein bet1 [Neolecta irregularis DAH-3]|eukprot:OLL23736.1 Protein transport protein bet1 [Neolecta irregularis DAH-3]